MGCFLFKILRNVNYSLILFLQYRYLYCALQKPERTIFFFILILFLFLFIWGTSCDAQGSLKEHNVVLGIKPGSSVYEARAMFTLLSLWYPYFIFIEPHPGSQNTLIVSSEAWGPPGYVLWY